MFRLRQTWNDIFPLNKLQTIDRSIHQLDSGWPLPAGSSSSTIHLNPLFLSRVSQKTIQIPTLLLFYYTLYLTYLDFTRYSRT